MADSLVEEAVAQGDDDAIRAILAEVCALTQMGFAAVARVTEHRWIACQVLDRIEFGLDPGDELKIHETICDEIRQSGQGVIIDEVGADPEWQRHPVPIIYGFESYVSIPIVLDDGSFYGTLCAIDPEPRKVNVVETVELLKGFAEQVARIISRAISEETPSLQSGTGSQ